MGAAGSVITLSALTAEQIGEMVAGLGAAYVAYQVLFATNGISGEVIASCSESEIKDTLKEIGVTNVVHCKVLMTHFTKLKNGAAVPTGGNSNPNDPDCCQYFALPSDFEVGEKVTKTPRQIMTKLFEIQGIAVDPTDLDPAIEKIAKAIGTGFGDGKNKYDCFINYRVASDADIAEKIFLYLRTKGIFAFLDKKCLKNGEKWKDGFLTGLKNSKCFVSLISRNALDRVRDETSDHTWDNVLLEYETALNIKDVTKNPKYICPLHVGQCDKGVLMKFIDFGSSLYPDSVGPIKKDSNPTPSQKPAPKTAPPPPPVANEYAEEPVEEERDEEEEAEVEEKEPEDDVAEHEHAEGDIGYCGVCSESLSLKPKGTWGDGWGCDWPGHEGSNYFQASDPLYGCPTIVECNWGVCQACWDNIQAVKQQYADMEKGDEGWESVDEPEGTRSKYNDDYYCDVKKVSCKLNEDGETFVCVLNYSVRGDLSMGPLQSPNSSRLVVGGQEFPPSEVKIYIQDVFQIEGDLIYTLSMENLPAFVQQPVGFIFGSSGYSQAVLVVPGSEYTMQLPCCTNGHPMTVSDYAEGNYYYGYVCDNCRQGKKDLRWFCEPCSSDLCFNCLPPIPLEVTCNKSHKMDRTTSNPKEYHGSARCDKCRRENLPYDPEFYHCKDCKYDLCLKCATEQIAEKQEA